MPEKLKKGWMRVAFGDVVRQVRDRADPEQADLERFVAGEHMDTDDLKIRRWGMIGDGYLGPAFHMRFKPGHVLYGSRRTYLRKVAVADFEGITANTTFVLEPKDPKVLLPELLPFIMQTESFHAHSIEQSKGSVNPYINYSDLTWYEFALPPLDEQRRIAEVLGAVGQALDPMCIALDAARRVRAILEEGHVANARRDEGTWKAVSDVSLLVTKGESPKWQGFEYCDRGTRFITSENVLDGVLSLAPEKFVPTQFGEKLARSRLQKGDILVNIVGGSIGRIAAVRSDLGDANVNQAVAVIRPDPARILPDYLQLVLSTPSIRRSLCHRKVDDYKPNLSLTSIRTFAVPVPPLNVQRTHCESVGTAMQCIARLEERANSARVLRVSAIRELCGGGK